MIAQELEVSLHMAFVEARQQRHEFITVEHLLLALLDNPSAAEVLRACSANLDDLRKASAVESKALTQFSSSISTRFQPKGGRISRMQSLYVSSNQTKQRFTALGLRWEETKSTTQGMWALRPPI